MKLSVEPAERCSPSDKGHHCHGPFLLDTQHKGVNANPKSNPQGFDGTCRDDVVGPDPFRVVVVVVVLVVLLVAVRTEDDGVDLSANCSGLVHSGVKNYSVILPLSSL